MLPKDFVEKYLPYAKEAEKISGISAIAVLAQAALESQWGEKAKENNFFGIKSFKKNDKRQLFTTTEILSSSTIRFPEILHIEPIEVKSKTMYRYTVKDWFMSYDTPKESFLDHSNFLIRNHNYAKALEVKSDPEKFLTALSLAGYATDPNYAHVLIQIVHMINKLL